jgi:hypothetical protein
LLCLGVTVNEARRFNRSFFLAALIWGVQAFLCACTSAPSPDGGFWLKCDVLYLSGLFRIRRFPASNEERMKRRKQRLLSVVEIVASAI